MKMQTISTIETFLICLLITQAFIIFVIDNRKKNIVENVKKQTFGIYGDDSGNPNMSRDLVFLMSLSRCKH